jgi:2-polyprenyl-3-methyl-5-hydroxy-6-metoxy-1,4-benzoquinol methylase
MIEQQREARADERPYDVTIMWRREYSASITISDRSQAEADAAAPARSMTTAVPTLADVLRDREQDALLRGGRRLRFWLNGVLWKCERLPPGRPMSVQASFDNSPRSRRMIQGVIDLAPRPINECSVLDLGCAHGNYALEFAKRGARALGIEGRASWLAHAEAQKNGAGLMSVDFVQDDVRNLSVDKYGKFDIVLCLGLLYHLGAQDALNLLRSIYDTCNDFAVIDTQIALYPDQSHTLGGHTYRGWVYREHSDGATQAEKEANSGASLEEDFSFWFSRPSLLNALRHVGFTSVFECLNPVDNMWVNGELKLHADYVTMVAFKGMAAGPFIGAPPTMQPEIDWPEDPTPYYLERPWSRRP